MRDDPAPPKTIRSPADLVAAGLRAPAQAQALEPVSARYAMAISPAMARLIDPADPHDPIARQFVPDPRELETRAHEREDPIGDDAHAPLEGIVHRYPDRVLLKLLHACPVYCRFCFRRESVGPGGEALSPQALARALDYIRADANIWETILTGGDPLAMAPRRLKEVARALRDIPHVQIMRVHTRVPVVAPERIDAEMIDALKAFGRSVYVALHANHPRELAPEARAACARLVDAGMPMVSQTVLLKGVNDDADVLGALMRAFVECRVKPYYLHHPDLAPGTAHLRVDLARGREIVAALRGRYSGLCQPEYVLDAPGGFGKAPVAASAAEPMGEGRWRVTDFRGGAHDYEDLA
jgi:lysine 2,3-aminomutase